MKIISKALLIFFLTSSLFRSYAAVPDTTKDCDKCVPELKYNPDHPIIKIEFNENGQLISALPPMITDNDQIEYVITTTKGWREKKIVDLFNRIQLTIKSLDESDLGKSKILKTLNLDGDPNAGFLLEMTKGKLAQLLIDYINNPDYSAVLAKQFDPKKMIKRLEKYTAVSNSQIYKPYVDYIQVPKMDNLVFPDFYLEDRVDNIHGLNNKKQCREEGKFEKHNCVCGLVYTKLMPAISISEGPVGYNYFIRMNSNVSAEVRRMIIASDVLTADASPISALNTDDVTKDFKAALDLNTYTKNGSPAKADDIKLLQAWFNDREAKAETDPPAPLIAAFSADKIKWIADGMKKVSDKYQGLKSKEALAWIFQFLWVSGGQNFSANIFTNGTLVGRAKKITDINNTIKKLKRDSIALTADLALLDHSASAANSAGNIINLNTEYQRRINLKRATDSLMDLANTQLKEAKKANTGILALLDKPMVQSDSLLYQGLFYVNHRTDYNNKYYAYMMAHDALEDYHLKGREPLKFINEKQRVYVLVDNAPPKKVYLLKTNISTIALASDNSAFDGEITRDLNVGEAHAAPPPGTGPALIDLFNQYEALKTLYAPFVNGITTLPIPIQKDATPDYITRMVPHQGPSTAPQTVAYQILDSVTNKNVNSEGATFSYRFDKLFRFRIKAGLAYSFLSTRTYTINATMNTATYSNGYTGLAPSIGLQFFTTPVDFQKTTAFPHGSSPFVYFGYLYTSNPAANLLLGGGWEVYSGFAFTAGLHFGKSQGLSIVAGSLQEQDYYKIAPFISINVGIEAFTALFNNAKTVVNPFK